MVLTQLTFYCFSRLCFFFFFYLCVAGAGALKFIAEELQQGSLYGHSLISPPSACRMKYRSSSLIFFQPFYSFIFYTHLTLEKGEGVVSGGEGDVVGKSYFSLIKVQTHQ